MKKVYTNDGHCLGHEWVNLSGLQEDTKKAILQMIYLNKTVDFLNDKENKRTNHMSPMDKCLAMGDSDAVNNFNYGSGT